MYRILVENFNEKSLYLKIGAFVFCYLVLCVYAIVPEESRDVYWHLKMGQDWLENGLSPYKDHYSFTNYGDSISAVPVLFQVIIANLVMMFGEQTGFYIFKLVYVFILLGVLAVYLEKIKAPYWLALIVIPFFSYFVAQRILLRPELISNILILICLIFYVKTIHSFNNKSLIAVSLLLLFWVNYHSPVLGYIIVFGLFLDVFFNKVIAGDKDIDWKYYIFWALLVFIVGFINMQGQHFVFPMIDFVLGGKGATTKEYLPSQPLYASNIMVHISWALSVCVIIWSAIKKQYGIAVISIILLYFSWNTVRLVVPASLITICMFAYLLSDFINKKEYLSFDVKIKKIMILSGITLAMFSYFQLTSLAINEYKHQEYRSYRLEARYPIQLTSYLKKHQKGGKIINPMSTGGYLLNSLAPEYKVYLDGRTNILYPLSRLDLYLKMLTYPRVMQEEIKRYDVDFVLLGNRPWLLSLVWGMEGMRLNYADDHFMLFSKDDVSNVFTAASLMSVVPACWNEGLIADVISEQARAKQIFSDEPYLIRSVLNMISAYSVSSDKEVFFNNQFENDKLPDKIRRLLGYMAMNDGYNDIALKYIIEISGSNNNDHLIAAYLLSRQGNNHEAEKVLLALTNSHVFYFMTDVSTVHMERKIKPYQTTLLLSILESISHDYDFKYFSGNDFSLLKEKHNEFMAKDSKNNDFSDDPANYICSVLTSGNKAAK